MDDLQRLLLATENGNLPVSIAQQDTPSSSTPIHDRNHKAAAGDASQPDMESALVEEASPSHGHMLTDWGLTTSILLADMFGLGTLTLPADFARLGWSLGIGSVVLCSVGMAYTGVLFTRLATMLPRTGRFDDYGHAAFGHAGRLLVGAVVYTTIFGEPLVFQLTCVESLKQILHTVWDGASWVSNASVGVGVAAVMLPMSQMQGLEEVGWVSIFGSVGMLVACLVVIVKLLLIPGPYPATEIIHKGTFNDGLVAFMDVVFTFGGQVNWIRYLSSMRHPSHFTRTVNAAASFMTAIYMATAAIGYQRLGYDFDHTLPITSVLPQDKWTLLANLGVLVHCIIAYQINLNVWTVMVLHLVAPRALESPTLPTSRATWFVVSAAGIVFSFFVALSLPFFSTVLALLAAIGDTSGAYALPALFNLKLFSDKMPRWERWLCYCIIPAASVLTCLGVYTSIMKLVEQLGNGSNELWAGAMFHLRA